MENSATLQKFYQRQMLVPSTWYREIFFGVSLKVVFKTAHCPIAETVYLVPLRLCCPLLNKLLLKRNKPSFWQNLFFSAMLALWEGMSIFRKHKLMYFKISQIIMALIFWMLQVLFYRLFSSILYSVLFPKRVVAVKQRWLSDLCFRLKKKKNNV